MIRDINDLKALKNRARSKVALRDPSLKNKVTVYNEEGVNPRIARAVANTFVAGAQALGYSFTVVFKEASDIEGLGPVVEIEEDGKISRYENVDVDKATEIFRAHVNN